MKAKILVLMAILLVSGIAAHAEFVFGNAPFVNSWAVLGLFEDKNGIDKDFIGEQTISPKLGDNTNGKTWKYLDDRLFSRNLDDYIDLFSYYKIKEKESINGVVAYAHIYVYSDKAQSVQVRYGADRFSKVFVNGKEIAKSDVGNPDNLTAAQPSGWRSFLWKMQQDNATKDAIIRDVNLNEGWNSVLVKIGTIRESVFGLYFRISDKDGNAVKGLTYSINGDKTSNLSIDNTNLDFDKDINMPTGFRDWAYVGVTQSADFNKWAGSLDKELYNSALSSTNFMFLASGGKAPYKFGVSGKLPSGLKFKNGILVGRISESAKLGDYKFKVTVKDSNGKSADKEFNLIVKERPNKWVEAGRLTALIHAPESIPAKEMPSFAKLIKEQGYSLVMPISYNNGQYRFRFPNVLNTIPEKDLGDIITPMQKVFKDTGVPFGMYVGNPMGSPHYSYDQVVLLYEDMYSRFKPDALWCDWLGVDHASCDAIFSIVKTINPDTTIFLNGIERFTNGDWDILCIEDLNTFGNPENIWGRWPYEYGVDIFKQVYDWPKANSLETWRFVREPSKEHPVVPDWKEFLRMTISNNSGGGITNLDHSYGSPGGIEGATADGMLKQHVYMRDWANPKGLEPLYHSYTNCYPLFDLGGDYGYANISLDGKTIYLQFLENPKGKKGLNNRRTLEFNNFKGIVKDAICMNTGSKVEFTQSGNTLSLNLLGLVQDPVSTIVKLSLEKPIKYSTKHQMVSNVKISKPIKKAGNVAFGKPSMLSSVDGLRKLEPSSFVHYATCGNDGLMDTFAVGAWEYAWSYEIDLQKEYSLSRIDVYFGGQATVYRLKVSTDKVNWTVLAEGKNDELKKELFFKFAPTKARWIRMDGLKPDDAGQPGGQMGIAELEAY